ncbi:hypothetical protein E4T56_gene11327 [Termitomyces sp. T112]|nr:hypothetical protein E4T56_gene11327 [Termitomyces sp. T112]
MVTTPPSPRPDATFGKIDPGRTRNGTAHLGFEPHQTIQWTTQYFGSLIELLTPYPHTYPCHDPLGQRRPRPSPKSVAPGKLLFF